MMGSSKNFRVGTQKINLANCRASTLGKSNLVTCQSDVILCQWRHTIGGNTLCAHTLNFLIAQTTQLAAQPQAQVVTEARCSA